jgi:hypothetical protein
MAKRLTRRSSPASAVDAPKALPARGKEVKEPDTYKCEDARTAVTAAERTPIGGMCEKCHINPSHSEVGHLCYPCRKAKDGFVFDEDKKMFLKGKKK